VGKYLLLAFRNIFRNRRRTIMTLVMVGGGVTGLLLVGGFFAYMYNGIREGTINNGLGHLQIFSAEHFTREEVRVLDTGIDNWRQVAANVKTGAHVRGIAPRIEFYGIISNGVKSSVYMGSAVDPDAEKSLGFSTHITSGNNLDRKSGGEVEALIGAGLAKSMNVRVGDGLTVLAMTSDGALNGIDVQIAGIVNSGIKEYDDRYLRITLPAAQRLLQSDRVTNLVVGLDATNNTDSVYDELAPSLQGQTQKLVLKKWIDLATSYKQIHSLFSTIYIFIGIIVFFMVLMSSVNTLLMTMFERTREIGTMLAMGTPRIWIIALFMVEALVLGVLGAIVGLAAGNLLASLIDYAGVQLPPPPGSMDPMKFYVLHVPSLMIGSSLLVIVSLVLASILPAIRASRLQIAEALAHV
jgi:putative ABC transport system permease protein